MSAWTHLVRSLDLAPGLHTFASGLKLERIAGEVIHLQSQSIASHAAVDKLAKALHRHTGQAICLVLRHGPHNAIHRVYRDKEEASCNVSVGSAKNTQGSISSSASAGWSS